MADPTDQAANDTPSPLAEFEGTTPPSHVNLPTTLEEGRITSLPPVAYYIPNFLSKEEENTILQKVPGNYECRLLPAVFLTRRFL